MAVSQVMTKVVGRTVGLRDRELSMKTLNRRDAIKVVVGASAALYTGCTRGEPPMTKLAEVQGLVPLPAGATPGQHATPFSFVSITWISIRRETQSVDLKHRLLVANSGKTLQVSMVGGCTMEPPCRGFQVTRIADLKRSRWCVRGFLITPIQWGCCPLRRR